MARQQLKASNYNFICNRLDERVLFFNFFSLTLLALSPKDAQAATRLLKNPNSTFSGREFDKVKKILIDNGFLIRADIDELNILSKNYFNSINDDKFLSLTIAPTLNCNFNCIYCYQEKKKMVMQEEVEKALISFVDKNLHENSSLNVTWFGGEPLLQYDIIKELSSSFLEICSKKTSKYQSSIVTNGYLLNRRMAKELSKLNIRSAQVTIDGPAPVHNKRRPLRGGGRTFDRLINNIDETADLINIDIRMNVDKENENKIEELLNELVKRKLNHKVGFYIGHTYPYTNVCADISSVCLSERDFSILDVSAGLAMVDRGFGSYREPRAINYNCFAEAKKGYVVCPNGELLKCWNDVGKKKEAVGHLLIPTSRQMIEKRKKWSHRNPFKLECKDCQLLPICMGGCLYLYNLNGKVDCHPWKYEPELHLLYYYYRKKIEQEIEVQKEFWSLVRKIKKLL